jgi:hypothetical protein
MAKITQKFSFLKGPGTKRGLNPLPFEFMHRKIMNIAHHQPNMNKKPISNLNHHLNNHFNGRNNIFFMQKYTITNTTMKPPGNQKQG